MSCTLAFLIVSAIAVAILLRVWRRCESLTRAKEAWKDYAVAIETYHECVQDEQDDNVVDYKLACRQTDNAVAAATACVTRLYESGEYPDAYGSSPVLPPHAPTP
jgi:hypothetical protein